MEKGVTYDTKGDVLYLWLKDPDSIDDIITEETDDELLLKKDQETGEIIGMAVMHFTARHIDSETDEIKGAETTA